MILETINYPEDIRKLKQSQLPTLIKEIKEYFIKTISKSGGHFASSLGALECTIALHYAYSTPDDKIVWDVGHQSYVHKIITGRKNKLPNIRHFGGISGFPNLKESKYDTFGVGHAGTAISAALGMALAHQHQQQDKHVVAVVGDGGMTAGMSFEALNHACTTNANLTIIHNDNQMSISPNVGALHSTMKLSTIYQKIRQQGERFLPSDSIIRSFAKKIDAHALELLKNTEDANLFSVLGCNYFGPIDGHDVHTLIQAMKEIKKSKGINLLHIITKKGYGYKLAEENPVDYHGVPPFDQHKGITVNNKKNAVLTFSEVFSKWINRQASLSKKLIAITPAMATGSGLIEFAKNYSDRFYDVGIAEQHAVTLAAGMATRGLKPVVSIYSTFLQRGYDQCLHDVLLQNLDVLFAIDRAGLVGGDGATHHGIYDLAFLRSLPNAVLMTPSNECETYHCLNTGYHYRGPAFVRYPRGQGNGIQINDISHRFDIGKGNVLHKGVKTVIFAFGPPAEMLKEFAIENNFSLVDMRFVKPLDEKLIIKLAKTHDFLISVEDHVAQAGAGSAILELLQSKNIYKPLNIIGLPDAIIEHGTQGELYLSVERDKKGVEKNITSWLKKIMKLV